jgi:hypothetical protein
MTPDPKYFIPAQAAPRDRRTKHRQHAPVLTCYGAIEFARAEDTWGSIADGTGTYDSVKGIVQIARDSNFFIQLAVGKSKPSDATLADFRNLRTKVNKAALSGRLSACYLDSTWEVASRASAPPPNPTLPAAPRRHRHPRRLPDHLDGRPHPVRHHRRRVQQPTRRLRSPLLLVDGRARPPLSAMDKSRRTRHVQIHTHAT